VTDKQDIFGYESLAFFGKVNASISHELKNVMAIISETAGLLGDLTEMASSGNPIELEALKSCTESIAEEIQRGFLTIKQMNRFSHSIDTPIESVNLQDLLDLVSKLCGYLAFTGKISVQPCEGFQPIAVTSPFLLQAIIYQAMSESFQHAGQGAEITIHIQPIDESAWRLVFSGFGVNEFHAFPDECTQKFADLIGVAIHWDRSADRLELEVPLSI
jgi:signal transduction histidine kinase